MKLLVIGSGGREHAICRALLADPKVTDVYCAQGNTGMRLDGIQLVNIAEDDHDALIAFAIREGIEWTFVGPEVPLMNGIVDDFQAAGLTIFGPNRKAALIEGSKAFAKEIMHRYHIPTAMYRTFSDIIQAKAYVESQGAPIVIKADGLAAGKGVVVAMTKQEAFSALEDMLASHRFGQSGATVVIEEYLEGEEFSLMAFVQEDKVYPMVIAQDHKRALDGDLGPNTGGMGAYSPVPQIPQDVVNDAIHSALYPTVQGMIKEGRPFTGILYAGLIATADGPKVIEFNARFGDPETQVVLARLTTSLTDIISALLVGEEPVIHWSDLASLGVVLAAQGYPAEYEKGKIIPEFSEEATIYYAGVNGDGKQLLSSGGRVLLAQALGETIGQAQANVYECLSKYDLSAFFYRKDIGYKAANKK